MAKGARKLGGCKHPNAKSAKVLLFNSKQYTIQICEECAAKKLGSTDADWVNSLKLNVAGITIQ